MKELIDYIYYALLGESETTHEFLYMEDNFYFKSTNFYPSAAQLIADNLIKHPRRPR